MDKIYIFLITTPCNDMINFSRKSEKMFAKKLENNVLKKYYF